MGVKDSFDFRLKMIAVTRTLSEKADAPSTSPLYARAELNNTVF